MIKAGTADRLSWGPEAVSECARRAHSVRASFRYD
jgi:hypothetical protein